MDMEKNWPLLVAGLAVVGGLVFAMKPGTQNTSYQTVGGGTDPQTAAIDAANLQAASQTQALEFQAFGSVLQAAQGEDIAALQLKDDAMKAAAGNYQAGLQAQVLTAQYADQLQAVEYNSHAATTQAFWHDLFTFGGQAAQASAGG